MDQLEPAYTAGGTVDWYLWKTVWQDLPEVEHKHIYSHSNSSPGYMQKYMYRDTKRHE